MKPILAASDPSWDSGERRTALLQELVAQYELTPLTLRKLTHRSKPIVNHWLLGHVQVIPVAVLRALMYDLQAGAHRDIQ